MALFSRKPRHRHDWQKSGEPYFIGPRGFKSGPLGPNPQLVDECVYGVTVFNWRCATCGKCMVERCVGRHLGAEDARP